MVSENLPIKKCKGKIWFALMASITEVETSQDCRNVNPTVQPQSRL
jgi:hypothetical protein